MARSLFQVTSRSEIRTRSLRLVAVALTVHGVWSSFELGMGTRLSMQMTLDWWNFEESVAGFFVHCIAIAGLYMTLTYYTMKWLQLRGRVTASPPAVPQNVHQ